jgi:hypothetical protein
MALLAASTTNPTATLQQSTKDIVLRRSTLEFAYRLQQAVGSVSLHFFLRTYLAASYLALSILLATRVIALQSYLASRFLAFKAALLLSAANSKFCASPKIKRLRKKVETEFFIMLLGPLNTVFLLAFWPGWLVVGATLWGFGLWSR